MYEPKSNSFNTTLGSAMAAVQPYRNLIVSLVQQKSQLLQTLRIPQSITVLNPSCCASKSSDSRSIMQSLIWASTVPLHLTHPSSDTPYILFFPRLSYLPLLIPRLSSFYGLPITSFSYEGIQLKNLPVGLLCDLYQPELPWKLELGDGPLFDIHDTFINSVKEVRIPSKSSHTIRVLHMENLQDSVV
jgi:hypothetical protein